LIIRKIGKVKKEIHVFSLFSTFYKKIYLKKPIILAMGYWRWARGERREVRKCGKCSVY
jgi:hypothetical protein